MLVHVGPEPEAEEEADFFIRLKVTIVLTSHNTSNPVGDMMNRFNVIQFVSACIWTSPADLKSDRACVILSLLMWVSVSLGSSESLCLLCTSSLPLSSASMCLFSHVFGCTLQDPLLVNGFSLSLLSQPVPEWSSSEVTIPHMLLLHTQASTAC